MNQINILMNKDLCLSKLRWYAPCNSSGKSEKIKRRKVRIFSDQPLNSQPFNRAYD